LEAIFLDNKKSSEISVEMNLKADTVRQRLKRTLDKLRKHFKPI
jgi:DNA-directed RNA polymerase specialized sigma24 family protein